MKMNEQIIIPCQQGTLVAQPFYDNEKEADGIEIMVLDPDGTRSRLVKLASSSAGVLCDVSIPEQIADPANPMLRIIGDKTRKSPLPSIKVGSNEGRVPLEEGYSVASSKLLDAGVVYEAKAYRGRMVASATNTEDSDYATRGLANAVNTGLDGHAGIESAGSFLTLDDAPRMETSGIKQSQHGGLSLEDRALIAKARQIVEQEKLKKQAEEVQISVDDEREPMVDEIVVPTNEDIVASDVEEHVADEASSVAEEVEVTVAETEDDAVGELDDVDASVEHEVELDDLPTVEEVHLLEDEPVIAESDKDGVACEQADVSDGLSSIENQLAEQLPVIDVSDIPTVEDSEAKIQIVDDSYDSVVDDIVGFDIELEYDIDEVETNDDDEDDDVMQTLVTERELSEAESEAAIDEMFAQYYSTSSEEVSQQRPQNAAFSAFAELTQQNARNDVVEASEEIQQDDDMGEESKTTYVSFEEALAAEQAGAQMMLGDAFGDVGLDMGNAVADSDDFIFGDDELSFDTGGFTAFRPRTYEHIKETLGTPAIGVTSGGTSNDNGGAKRRRNNKGAFFGSSDSSDSPIDLSEFDLDEDFSDIDL